MGSAEISIRKLHESGVTSYLRIEPTIMRVKNQRPGIFRGFLAFLLFFLSVAPYLYAAEVRNASSRQDGNRVEITYDLEGGGSSEEVLLTVTVEGKEYRGTDLHLEGDFGKVAPGRGKRIYWNVLRDFPAGLGDMEVDWSLLSRAESIVRSRQVIMEGTKTATKKAKSQQVTGTIEVLDVAAGNFTVKGKKGNIDLMVGEKVMLGSFMVGEKVVVKYADGIASSVKAVKVAKAKKGIGSGSIEPQRDLGTPKVDMAAEAQQIGLEEVGLEEELKRKVTDYYDQKGEWRGVFTMDSIEKIRIENGDGINMVAHVRYRYKPIQGNRKGRKDTGFDNRTFTINKSDSGYEVTKMGGYMSAKF